MDKEVKPLIDETYKAFSEAVDYGLRDNEIPTAMRLYLQDNVFVFSGFKAHTELRQASALLRDASGQIKPFNRFLTDIQKIDKDYNKTYLQAEYNFAVASSQAAARWQEIAEDGDDFLLQYRTAKDERVREQHRILDGITLPPSDKFWDEFFPPNGWNCRCSAVQVNPKRYPESNSEEAIQRGRAATYQPNAKGQNKAQIFRFNSGKQKVVFPPKHPYYPKNCGNCNLKSLRYDDKNDSCKKFNAVEKSKNCLICEILLQILEKKEQKERFAKAKEELKAFKKRYKDMPESVSLQDEKIHVNSKFFTETLNKNRKNKDLLRIMNVAFEYPQWWATLHSGRVEKSRHHDDKWDMKRFFFSYQGVDYSVITHRAKGSSDPWTLYNLREKIIKKKTKEKR